MRWLLALIILAQTLLFGLLSGVMARQTVVVERLQREREAIGQLLNATQVQVSDAQSDLWSALYELNTMPSCRPQPPPLMRRDHGHGPVFGNWSSHVAVWHPGR